MPATALNLACRYEVLANCSDNAPTSYLVNDACVLVGRPLGSASALHVEGQITVYHYDGGPCYRCDFPQPPPPPPAETVTNSTEGGVLGVVGLGSAGNRCGEWPTVTDLLDYEAFCGSSATDKCHSLQLLSPEERVSVTDYKRLLDSGAPHLLLDIRPQVRWTSILCLMAYTSL
ncbi:Molybdenum cofactor synthesis protein 3 [Saguinus oedipus]|uniref:Molybdenum cofactor synthesis protein 3 n=1 Tax=Saguinus oedipus TaxID=9490 RepID=A0ABQ9V4X1_SAGOE|nr:Molybdenum cofactor synthesis protein 3 [Saguinus oedipus]